MQNKKENKKKYRTIGCYEINPYISVIVSKMENGKICIAQRETVWEDREKNKKTYSFKHGSGLRLTPIQYRELLNMLIDLDL